MKLIGGNSKLLTQHCAKAITGDKKSVTKKTSFYYLTISLQSKTSRYDLSEIAVLVSKPRIWNLETITQTPVERRMSTLTIVLHSIEHT